MVIPPNFVSGAEAAQEFGKQFSCPLCRVQSTSDATDTGWVAMPELVKGPKWLCLGSWIDVAGVAQRDEPSEHPYYEDLVRLAELAGMSPDEMVRLLRRRQLELIRERPASEAEGELNALRHRLEEMVASAP